MAQLFLVVLSLSISGGLVGLLVLLFRPVFGRVFAKRWTYYLWFLVFARLLLPIHADVNLMEYFSGRMAAVGSALTDVSSAVNAEAGSERAAEADAQKSEAAVGNEPENVDGAEVLGAISYGNAAAAEDEINSAKGGVRLSFLQFAAVIWILGVLFAAFRKLWCYRRFVREIRGEFVEIMNGGQPGNVGEPCAVCAPVTDERVLRQYSEIRRKLGIQKGIPLYESAGIDSPMLMGIRQPRIYMPSALLAEMAGKENDICLILHHELVHYKRKDLWYKWLFQTALCVHWFNPFLYVFGRKFSIDCELACDEKVMTLLSEEGRRTYGNVLLDVAQKDWSEGAFSGKGLDRRGDVPAMTLLEEKSTLKERLRGIARYHKTGLVVGLCSATVLVMFLAVALVCGAAEIRAGGGKTFSLYNGGDFGTVISNPTFDPGGFIPFNTKGKAYQIYDDDALIAEDSESDIWNARNYTGGENSVSIKKFTLNGSDTLWILYANKETTLEVSSVFHFDDGRFKVVWVKPDQTVQTLNESGKESTIKITLPQGRNAIKMVGQKAKLEDVQIAYEGMTKEDFDGIYDNEATEYAYQVLEGKRTFTSVDLEEVCPYLKDKEVSELARKAWETEAALSSQNWEELFIYSDNGMTAQYLLEELQAGRCRDFDSNILVKIAPYMKENDVSECFRYLLERDAVSAPDWEDIFVYSDGNKSAEYLAEALRNGKGSGFSDRALQHICPYVSTGRLTDIVTAMEELSFDSLAHVLAFVQQMDEAAACVYHYIDLGNTLTDEQLREVQAYVSEKDFYRVVEYNGKRK